MSIRLPVIGTLESDRLTLIRRAFGDNFRSHLGRYVVAFTCMTLFAATTGATAYLIKDVVNHVFLARDASMLGWLVSAVIVLTLVKGASAYISEVTMAAIGNAIVAASQRRMFAHVLALDIARHGETRSSEMITRMSQNAADMRELMQVIVTAYGRDALTVIALVIVMLVQDPYASLFVLVVGPAVFLAIARLAKRLRTTHTLGFWAMTRAIGILQQTVQGIRVVKAYDLAGVLTNRIDEAIDEAVKRANKAARITARSSLIGELLGGLAVTSVIAWGGYAVIFLNRQPGQFLSFLAALMLAYEPLKRLGRNHMMVERSLVGVRLMYELLDVKPRIESVPAAPDLRVASGDIRFERVRFAYEPAAPLFTGLDFHAEPGRMTALVGPSGGGKSTVMALLERFYDPEAGRVLIDGQDIAKVGLSSLRRAIAYVGQDSFMFEGSIADNIGLGRPGAARAEIEEAARAAMAHDFIAGLPQGYDTAVGEQGANLSGGQRQRIAIARAMLRDAPIILLDEATSALDAESEHLVQIAFERLMKGRTTIVIAHRLATVLNADRICVMADGRIVEEGRHADLIATGGLYARLYSLQFDPASRAIAAE